MNRQTTTAVFLMVIIASVALGASVVDMIKKSEQLWLDHKYDASTLLLEEALKVNPTNEQTAEIYWRQCRNYYEAAEEMPKEAKAARMSNAKKMQVAARKCIELAPRMGECYLWMGAGLGREGTQKGILNMLGKAKDIETAWLKAIELKPSYRAFDGRASAYPDSYYALGMYYRLVPEWGIIKLLYGTKGDKKKSVELLRKAIEMEPKRVEYAKELGVSLVCLGQSTKNQEVIDEGVQWLKKAQTIPTLKPTDEIDKQHCQMVLKNLKMACGYSRDVQQDVSRESFKGK